MLSGEREEGEKKQQEGENGGEEEEEEEERENTHTHTHTHTQTHILSLLLKRWLAAGPGKARPHVEQIEHGPVVVAVEDGRAHNDELGSVRDRQEGSGRRERERARDR